MFYTPLTQRTHIHGEEKKVSSTKSSSKQTHSSICTIPPRRHNRIASITRTLALGAFAYATLDAYSGYYGYDVYGALGWGWTIYIGFGAWMLITSILIIAFASKLKANPLEHSKWGALILIFSIIGVGGLFGLIGGILALVYKPVLVGAAPQYAPQQPYYGPQPQQVTYQQPPQQYVPQQPITRICPQCGRVVQENLKFCPNCGKQLN